MGEAMGEAIREKNFRPVSDQVLLATLELAVRCCRRDPDHFVNTEEEKEALTHVLLSFQSVLFSEKFQEGLEGKTSFESLGPEAWAEFLRNRMAHNTHHYYRASRALREGRAVRAKEGSAIEGIRFVVPCVVTYDTIPLFHPVSEFYETHLQKKTGLKLVRAEDGIEPLQFFTVDFLESWRSRRGQSADCNIGVLNFRPNVHDRR